MTEENQEVLSKRCSLIRDVLQGLVKTCKRYMEANHFLILICRLEKYFLVEWSLIVDSGTRKQCIVFLSSLVYSLWGICLSGGNCFRGKFYGEGEHFSGDNFPRRKLSGRKLCGEQLSGGNFP